jgi:hypothetical protein
MSKEPGQQPLQDPNGLLESELINEFLRTRGYDLQSLKSLPDDERRRLLRQASMYAAGRLTEIEARAHFVDGLHGDTDMG